MSMVINPNTPRPWLPRYVKLMYIIKLMKVIYLKCKVKHKVDIIIVTVLNTTWAEAKEELNWWKSLCKICLGFSCLLSLLLKLNSKLWLPCQPCASLCLLFKYTTFCPKVSGVLQACMSNCLNLGIMNKYTIILKFHDCCDSGSIEMWRNFICFKLLFCDRNDFSALSINVSQKRKVGEYNVIWGNSNFIYKECKYCGMVGSSPFWKVKITVAMAKRKCLIVKFVWGPLMKNFCQLADSIGWVLHCYAWGHRLELRTCQKSRS